MERREAAGAARGVTTNRSGGADPICTVVIPTYNGRDLLARCLASFDRHRPDPARWPIEVVVVDNGSSDGTSEWLARKYPSARLLRIEPNRDFCAAANAGMAAARAPFVQLLNNDTEVTPGWIEAGLAPFEDPTVGSVAPLVVVRSDPKRVDSAGDSYAWYGWPRKRGHGQETENWTARPAEEVFGASGSSAFYRTEALRRAGTFDLFLVSYYEDIDLAFRLRWAGYRCVYAPGCRIHHEISATNDHKSPALQRRIARNAELVFWWNLPAGSLALAAIPHLVFTAMQAGWRLVRRRPGPFLAGKLDAVAAWRVILDRRRARVEIARSSERRPHFALSSGSLGEVRHHLRRPNETTRATSGARFPG